MEGGGVRAQAWPVLGGDRDLELRKSLYLSALEKRGLGKTEGGKVRRQKARLLVCGVSRGEKTDLSLPKESKPFLAFPDYSLPTCCLPEGCELTWVSLAVASQQQCEYSSTLQELAYQCFWITGWKYSRRKGIFSLMHGNKVLKCQHDKNKINNDNIPMAHPKISGWRHTLSNEMFQMI